ncbi:F-box protein At3g07870-like [Impatiens glandulifera]|uniref:F-box protein At3g07870-like n=1 Tax=Impatiens glandulifera TaxID=253017 RepID=UPI001FB0616F|nr:F-box protein At3g07870-like [Impatiens glandulifera]
MEKELAGSSTTTSIWQLPNHILVDILSRLPIKSVIQCRCVCKSFLSAISQDPDFPPLHLSRSPPELMLYQQNIQSEHLYLVDDDDDNEQRYHHFNLVHLNRSHSLEPLNSTPGLLCFHQPFSLRPLVVLNPVTLEHTIIPTPMHSIHKFQSHTLHFGFGYSPLTHRYKVLVIGHYIQSVDSTTPTTRTLTAICTVGGLSSYWKIIQDAPQVFSIRSSPVYLNGSLHWIVTNNSHYYILSFDFDNGKYREMATPPPFDKVEEKKLDERVTTIVVFEGLLTVCVLIDHKRVDIWMMKEYGVDKSWSKEIVVETPYHVWSSGVYPLKYLNKDKDSIVLAYMGHKTIVTYHLIEKMIINLNVLPFQNGGLKPLMHVPILLPLKDLIIGAHVRRITDARHKWQRWMELEN